ncbi:hypothetical protein BH11ACT8_BH11ACT8_25300 [soil metagenome]
MSSCGPSTRDSLYRQLRFLAGGGFNAASCVLLSQGFYLLLHQAVPAFTMGYLVSLTMSYFVNAIFVFRVDRLSVRRFAAFCLSYVPNFAIQFGLVAAMTNWLGVLPLLAYLIGVATAVPLTYLILARVTFRPDPVASPRDTPVEPESEAVG